MGGPGIPGKDGKPGTRGVPVSLIMCEILSYLNTNNIFVLLHQDIIYLDNSLVQVEYMPSQQWFLNYC